MENADIMNDDQLEKTAGGYTIGAWYCSVNSVEYGPFVSQEEAYRWGQSHMVPGHDTLFVYQK